MTDTSHRHDLTVLVPFFPHILSNLHYSVFKLFKCWSLIIDLSVGLSMAYTVMNQWACGMITILMSNPCQSKMAAIHLPVRIVGYTSFQNSVEYGE